MIGGKFVEHELRESLGIATYLWRCVFSYLLTELGSATKNMSLRFKKQNLALVIVNRIKMGYERCKSSHDSFIRTNLGQWFWRYAVFDVALLKIQLPSTIYAQCKCSNSSIFSIFPCETAHNYSTPSRGHNIETCLSGSELQTPDG